MKKIFLALLSISCFTLSAQAFGDLRIGATAGYNLTKVSYDRATLEETLTGKNGNGFYVGLKAKMGLFMGLGLDAALVYNQRDHKIASAQQSLTYTAKSFDIPLNARFDLSLGGAGIYLAAGPNFSFNVGDKQWNTETLFTETSFNNFKGVFQQSNLVTSLNIGGGLRFSDALEVGLTYNIPMTSTGYKLLDTVGLPSGSKFPSYKTHLWSLNATFYF